MIIENDNEIRVDNDNEVMIMKIYIWKELLGTVLFGH